MKTSQYGIDLIKHFEGCELEAYQCAAGVWTIGYGHTKGVQPGDQWSESHANHMLEVELEEVKGLVDLIRLPFQISLKTFSVILVEEVLQEDQVIEEMT